MNYLDSLYWIHERTKFGIKPGVKRMEWMLAQLGHPERNINVIHIGGTNGKGSTVAYLREALMKNNYQIGTFTSPYIETFNERISVNGHPISNEAIAELATRVKPISEAMEEETELGTATEFEIITTMMYLYFGEFYTVDFVLVEAGLGVKNDSTNVIHPVLSILTSIGLDHTDILGNSYLDIARDKSAIIKENTPVIYAIKNDDAIKQFRDTAERLNAKAIEYDRDILIKSEDDEFTYRYKEYELENIALDMKGEHQKENAALAITALIELYEQGVIKLDFNSMIEGIEHTYWTGRIEEVSKEPLMIIDGAHNKESIDALVDTIHRYYELEKVDVLFSAIDGKPIHHMLTAFNDIAEHIYVTEFDFPKALPKHTLYDEVEFTNKSIVDNFVDFIKNYQGDCLLITGSLYFISEVKSKIDFN
ncbi:bifunctional folylpolyglutamate synthase/dihydrofolate synthase [Staphylococcus felis]|uniref:bifunctional folylpolyglutamate synthase/dihydrofolate synthase n=1 Tax=Staphylococcus felis TaxID=46127 RepID=UPI000E265C4D|nr:folylpolyglutamate synthase/dihydrofolate synthase family protein [Staphylococcus felis]REH76763.1 bifunctional folylpolyglutamate synthase/dihydrofolate synthase [Staphylococcus felis]REH97826.1 bifunctional folylpolyglutamate synthase/dihydrofolate synthase [Staphylococcus felis]REI02320.1 bifunctional folylpolyglutamate synthase/dihydrofolate synthase [Staphylococcus felis]REI07769.1 bifunctional folylpolyglutamate synthase/dihydrofolate synthase [Staphylococcus felis]REI12944.1 bifuncti